MPPQWCPNLYCVGHLFGLGIKIGVIYDNCAHLIKQKPTAKTPHDFPAGLARSIRVYHDSPLTSVRIEHSNSTAVYSWKP